MRAGKEIESCSYDEKNEAQKEEAAYIQPELITKLQRASQIGQLVKNPPAMQETPVRFLGGEDSPGKGMGYPLQYSWASLVAQTIKNLPAMWETWVRSLG